LQKIPEVDAGISLRTKKAFGVQSTNNESRLSPVLDMEVTRWELVGGLLQAFAWFELLEINFDQNFVNVLGIEFRRSGKEI